MAVPSMITFQSLAKSGMPSDVRASLNRWYNSANGPENNPAALAKLHVKAGAEAARTAGVGAIAGAALGAAHAMLPTGLDFHKVPLDAVGGLLALAAGTAMAQEEFGKDVANAGAAAIAIFGFRKTNDLVIELKARAAGITPGGGAAPLPGRISKASFGAEGWAPGSKTYAQAAGHDPIISAAAGL